MTVHFIGAGPGAADLITVRGRDLIARCPVCLYAGSIVPRELLEYCPKDAHVIEQVSVISARRVNRERDQKSAPDHTIQDGPLQRSYRFSSSRPGG